MSENTESNSPGFWKYVSAIYRFRIAGFLVLVSAILLIQTACSSDYFFQKKIDFPDRNWTYSDTINFKFSITDTLEIYNLYLDIEHADTFSTQNIYIKLYTRFPDGKRLSKVKSFDLYDLQGKPNGQCSGRQCLMHTILQEKAFFNSPGEYEITLEQFTREPALPGIFSIGLAIEATGIRR
jgi:gliding motility-associated lipoprotein GldH